MVQAHLFISGFVQGVGYRHFVRKNASELGLTGWVRNLPARNASLPDSQAERGGLGASVAGGPDNRVEVVAQGAKEKLEQLVKLCRKGPFLAEVEDVEVVWEDAKQQYPDFQIIA